MAAIAAFAATDQGRMYGSICERWGVDPAAGWADDVLALNFRAVLAVAHADVPTTEPAGDERAAAAAANELAWLGG